MTRLYILLFSDVIRRLNWRFSVLIAWTALAGLGEGISVVLLLPLLSLIGVAAANNQGIVITFLHSGLALLGATTPLGILVVIVVVAAVQTALAVALTWWTAILARRYQSQRQLEMFAAFMRARWTFIADKKSGEITNAIITESERLGAAFTICLSLLASLVVTIIYIVLALIIAWQVTLSLIGFAIAVALAMAQLYKTTYAAGQSLAPLNADFQSVLTEHFAGAKFIKASAGVDRATARIESLVQKIEKTSATASSLPGTVRSLLEFLAFVGLATILVLSSRWVGLAAGNVVIVLALFGRLFPRISTLQAQLHHLNWNVPAVEVIDKLQAAAQAEAERQDDSKRAFADRAAHRAGATKSSGEIWRTPRARSDQFDASNSWSARDCWQIGGRQVHARTHLAGVGRAERRIRAAGKPRSLLRTAVCLAPDNRLRTAGNNFVSCFDQGQFDAGQSRRFGGRH